MNTKLIVVFVALAALLAIACSPKSGVGLPCVSSENCPGNLTCMNDACAEPFVLGDDVLTDDEPSTKPRLPKIRPEGDVDIIAEGEGEGEGSNLPPDVGEGEGEPDPNEPDVPVEPVDPTPGWNVVPFDRPLSDKPRVVPSASGVEVYFLESTSSTCEGLTRAYPDGTLTDLVGPVGGGCFKEMDAQRTSDGVVHVVMRTSFIDYSEVVFVTFGPNLLGDSAFSPETYDEHRGVRARVALAPNGDPDWLWSVRQASGPDLIEQLHVTSTSPQVVLEVEDLVDDLDYVVDGDSNPALFATIFQLGPNGDPVNRALVMRTGQMNITVDAEVFGSLEAVRCGGAVHVAYRRGDELVVARTVGTSITSKTVVAAGLSTPESRPRGDVAIACDAGNVWTAWTDSGAVHVAQVNGPIETVSAAVGGVALAVVGGVPHVAFGETDPSGATSLRHLRYATRP